MMGRARSSSVKPVPLSIARAGARSGPSVIAALLRLAGSLGRAYGFSDMPGTLPDARAVPREGCSDTDTAVGARRTPSGGAYLELGAARPMMAARANRPHS